MTAATIVFFPEGAYGPTNNCVGIGQVLRERGHRVVFVIEESFAGNLEAQGFEERLMRLGPPPEVEEEPGQFWKDFIRETAPVFRKPTIEQLGGVHRADVARALRRGALRRRPAARDLRRAAARRDRRGQRRLLPGDPPRRSPVGADRLVQPARGEGPGAPARVLRLPGRRPRRLGRVPRRVPRARSPSSTASSAAFCAERGAPAAARRRVHPRVRPGSTSTSIRRRSTTRAARRSRRRGIGSTPASRVDATPRASRHDARRRGRRSSTSRSAASARRTST